MDIKEISPRRRSDLQKSIFFSGISSDALNGILADRRCRIEKYSRDDTVFDENNFKKCLVYICTGSLKVSKSIGDGRTIPLRTLEEKGFFGAAALFNDENRYVTKITAMKDCVLIFFDQELIEEALMENPVLALNYIRFLSMRIRFLNEKVEMFAASSGKNALVGFLLNQIERSGETVKLNMSYSQLAKQLNISRASLYRSMDELEENGIICRNGKDITVFEPDILRQIGK